MTCLSCSCNRWVSSWSVGRSPLYGDSGTHAPFICTEKRTQSNHGNGNYRKSQFPLWLGKRRKLKLLTLTRAPTEQELKAPEEMPLGHCCYFWAWRRAGTHWGGVLAGWSGGLREGTVKQILWVLVKLPARAYCCCWMNYLCWSKDQVCVMLAGTEEVRRKLTESKWEAASFFLLPRLPAFIQALEWHCSLVGFRSKTAILLGSQ